MNYKTIRVRHEGPVCFLQLYRPDAGNAINDLMIKECGKVLTAHEESATVVVVLEGLPNVFCLGADFSAIHKESGEKAPAYSSPEPFYDLLSKLAEGPYITIAHVRGKVNAGGVGFAAASDIVLADAGAVFSLSELLFGLFPACVLPFLIRRIGFQKAHYMTMSTLPFPAAKVCEWGLVDACGDDSEQLLRRHLLRIRRLSKTSVARYKQYVNHLEDLPIQARSRAVAANREIFSDPGIIKGICRFVEDGKFPWEDE